MNLKVILKLKKDIERAELLDVFSSDPILIPDFCPESS